jgi:cyclopropane fatty-acyl-phospholipid synthase-like methyltransferase
VPIRVLDIACGHGHYGIAIAKQNPLAEIFAQDWPAVLEVAVANARNGGISRRYHTIPGDVFSASLGEGYDLALVTNFLPNFGPAECEQLLARIRSTLRNDGRVVALQRIPEDDRLSPPNAPSLALSLLAQTPRVMCTHIGNLRRCSDAQGLCGLRCENSAHHFSVS